MQPPDQTNKYRAEISKHTGTYYLSTGSHLRVFPACLNVQVRHFHEHAISSDFLVCLEFTKIELCHVKIMPYSVGSVFYMSLIFIILAQRLYLINNNDTVVHDDTGITFNALL
jgi:hypothetical protein